MQSISDTPLKPNKKKFVYIMLLFILPALAATALYLSGWKPGNTVNSGTLIVPARLIAENTLQTLDNKPFKFSELHGKWTMLYFDSSGCDQACMQQLYFMRQTHRSQGKNFNRMQRVFILTDSNDITAIKAKLTDYPDMLVLTADKKVLSDLQGEMAENNSFAQVQHDIFLMDPLGYLMMRYIPESDPAGIRKDLDRLFKYSSDN
jgi:cytochrome oxidase Cu insertion factor (SCO1/SenC/PrrC family)